jgi:hypothetical protein
VKRIKLFSYLRGVSKEVGEAVNQAMSLVEGDNAEALTGVLPKN